MSDGGAEQRLAAIYSEISRLGLQALVMGGHAVRFYGVDRNTVDYDLVIALPGGGWAELPRILSSSPLLAAAREGPSWRGTIADGREERLEFWRRNHLLAEFSELDARKSVGRYGGASVGFLGLDDLIRSKETEREDDWRDVRLLEEIADERRLAGAPTGQAAVSALATLRSQRGFETARRNRLLGANEETGKAAAIAEHPVTRAFLAPYVGAAALPPTIDEAIRSLLVGPLSAVEPGAARHLAMVEAVRRLYQRKCMADDRADKERALSGR